MELKQNGWNAEHPPMAEYEHKLTDEHRRELDEHGFTIVRGVITRDEAETFRQRFWDWIEGMGFGIRRKQRKTWKAENWPSNLHGILQGYGVGQRQFVWDMRSHQNVYGVFADLWQDGDLLSSFDGACLSVPGWPDEAPWPHFDQGPRKTGLQCFQGFVNLVDCGPTDGGLVVRDKSCTRCETFYATEGLDFAGDWYRVNQSQMQTWFSDCAEVKVCCNAGDMVLWDSRTIHYARLPKGDSERMVIYTCMTPRSRAEPGVLEQKITAFQNGRMTNHWPHEVHLFREEKEWRDVTVDRTPPQLNRIGRRLAGFEE